MTAPREVPTMSKTLTIRVPEDLHEQLLTYKFFTGKSVNEVAVSCLGEFIAGAGADEMVAAMGDRARVDYALALAKLAD
jgi:hypothetical protein